VHIGFDGTPEHRIHEEAEIEKATPLDIG